VVQNARESVSSQGRRRAIRIPNSLPLVGFRCRELAVRQRYSECLFLRCGPDIRTASSQAHGAGKTSMNILLIDDDQNLRKSLRLALETMNHKVTEAGDSAQAQEFLGHGLFDVAFLDLRLGRERGTDVLPSLLRLAPGLAVVVVTAYATIETAVEAMRRGAFDYLPKPFTPNQLRVVLDRVAHLRRLQSHVEELEAQVRAAVPEADLQTDEQAMRQALDVAFKAAPTDATVLIRGESGTGKGVLARAVHARSARAAGPF